MPKSIKIYSGTESQTTTASNTGGWGTDSPAYLGQNVGPVVAYSGISSTPVGVHSGLSGATYLVSTTSDVNTIAGWVSGSNLAVAVTLSTNEPNQPTIAFAAGHVADASESVGVTVSQENHVLGFSGTESVVSENTVPIHGQYVNSPEGNLVIATIEPRIVDRSLAIRELNRQLEGWTPRTNTQSR